MHMHYIRQTKAYRLLERAKREAVLSRPRSSGSCGLEFSISCILISYFITIERDKPLTPPQTYCGLSHASLWSH